MSKKSEERQKYQFDFVKNGLNIEVGNINDLPISIDELIKIKKEHKFVDKYSKYYDEVLKYQINDLEDYFKWRERRIDNLKLYKKKYSKYKKIRL